MIKERKRELSQQKEKQGPHSAGRKSQELLEEKIIQLEDFKRKTLERQTNKKKP